jgi:hypothetical protein
MAISYGEKAQRVLKLLLGLRNRRVAAALTAYGFTEADMRDGWARLQALGGGKLDGFGRVGGSNAIQELDAWENEWFPIAGAALEHRFPAAHARLFMNLSQTEGPEVAVSVHTFLERLEAMKDPNGAYGAEGPKARERLESRGLNAATVERARSLVASLATIEPDPGSLAGEEQNRARDEEALWGWYLEWSQIARVAIKNRKLLRELGFLVRPSGPAEEEEPEVVPAATTPVTPGPVTA